jgi:hypothetical protein
LVCYQFATKVWGLWRVTGVVDNFGVAVALAADRAFQLSDYLRFDFAKAGEHEHQSTRAATLKS